MLESDSQAIVQRPQLMHQYWELLRFKERSNTQKSRARWIKEGDLNTRYFHSCLKSRQLKNQLMALHSDDKWLESVDDIRNAVTSYFQNQFKESDFVRLIKARWHPIQTFFSRR